MFGIKSLTSRVGSMSISNVVGRSTSLYSSNVASTSALYSTMSKSYSANSTSTTLLGKNSNFSCNNTINNYTRTYSTQQQQQEPNINILNDIEFPDNRNEIRTPTGVTSHQVIDFNSKQVVGEINLLNSVFKVPLRIDLLHRMIRWQRAKARQGTHYAQNMGDVERTNKKPMAQKGNGRARQGTNHAIQMVGGARAFPPKPRDHSHSLQKKVRKQALCVALSTKLAQGKLIIVDDLQVETHKTKELVQLLPEAWGRSLLVNNEFSNNFNLAAYNIINIDLVPDRGINVYSILQKDTLVISKKSIEILQARLTNQDYEFDQIEEDEEEQVQVDQQ
ncbi:hypothetical protein DFA_06052 [Cavenderia fasciculata]|uniref:Large ribosomal subunit protein uL4m n=1 Tax=Cavenderia fasciculata TaxID=261658 RepID=F4PJZ0_CACFS|nr:uncharacterized protein DFA_06052 [Cavenderia fasciculata]EGG23914.1 hypothetical protein DFA_06052 [Cavenderia fasciculata]|eukprot:XP_004361765.1 hypothetical protein DFA_06052 [Cavenderia fasciculata]